MIKIAFFDVDGTLLKFGNKELSEKTRKALLALQRKRAGEEALFKNPLDAKDKQRILQNLKNMNRAIAIGNEDFVVTNGTDRDLEHHLIEEM